VFALQAVALFFVADFFAEIFFEGFEKVEGDVGGLEVGGVGVGDVVDQRAQGCGAGNGDGLMAAGERRGVNAGEHTGGDGFGVAFDTGNLAGEEDCLVGSSRRG